MSTVSPLWMQPEGRVVARQQAHLPAFKSDAAHLRRCRVIASPEFTLRDAQGDKPHLSGSLRPLE